MWKSRVQHLVIHVSLHSPSNCFWHVPLWVIYRNQMNMNQYITVHCTLQNHNTHCIATDCKIAASVSSCSPVERLSHLLTCLSALKHRAPGVDWSQWEKMVPLSISPDATHAAFYLFIYFYVPQAAALFLPFCLYISLSWKTLTWTTIWRSSWDLKLLQFYAERKYTEWYTWTYTQSVTCG